MVESLIIKKAADLLFSALDKLFKRSTLRANEKQSGILISEAIQELLRGAPNLNVVRSKLAKAENISSAPSEELMSAREMLEKVEKSGAKKALVNRRRKQDKGKESVTKARKNPNAAEARKKSIARGTKKKGKKKTLK